MNRPEFNEWWSGYRSAFPDAAEYFAKLKNGGKETLEVWLEVFSDVTLDDAKAVTMMMAKGEIPPIANYNRGETASTIRRTALDLAHKRMKASEEPDWKQVDDRVGRSGKAAPQAGMTRSMRADMQRVIAMKKAGATKAEVEAFVKKQYPEDLNDRRERYACLRCRATGMVTVWSERAMRAVLEGTIENRINRTTCGIPCDCPIGERKVVIDLKRPGAFRRRFDPYNDVPCIDPDSLDCVNDLEKFVEERKYDRPRNYETGFDNYADDLGHD